MPSANVSDGDRGEGGTAAEPPDGVVQVAHHLFQPEQPAWFTHDATVLEMRESHNDPHVAVERLRPRDDTPCQNC